jgi:hypothetical protein
MTSFLDLPAELRIDIYGYIIGSLDGAPTSARLKEYRSFLLSCSQVHNELEAEALKVTNAFLAQVQSAWTITAAPLHLPTLTKLSDTVSIPIGVPGAVKILPLRISMSPHKKILQAPALHQHWSAHRLACEQPPVVLPLHVHICAQRSTRICEHTPLCVSRLGPCQVGRCG